MAKNRKESFFWTSYSDLMTSLFFVMLLLFILTIILLHKRMVQAQRGEAATKAQLEKITELENSIKNIDTVYFGYNNEYKTHVLRTKVKFEKGSASFGDISEETKQELYAVRDLLRDSLQSFVKSTPDASYLLIIEGQASKFRYDDGIPDEYGNYRLSYRRALGLIQYWATDCSIKFGDNCEIQIAGSGDGILPIPSSIREKEERKNQRFLIHILPKNIINDAADEIQ